MSEGASEPAPAGSEHARERTRRALYTTLTALAGRGVGFVLSFISLPLTIGYLDTERYGLWITIGSFLAWLGIADLGLGNGLSNAVTRARAGGDHEAARTVVSTAFVLLTVVALVMAIAFAVAFPFVPWARVFAVTSRVDRRELSITVALCLAVFAVSFPLGVVDRVIGACQEGYIANYYATATAVVTTIALVLAVRFASGLPTLVLVLSVLPLVTRAGWTGWVFGRLHPELSPRISAYQRATAKTLLATGGTFLVVQLAALGMWQNDNLVIAQLFGAAAVGPYSVAFRLATLYVGIVNMYLGPLWPAYADAAARGDHAWIRDTVRRTTRQVTWATVGAAIGLIAVGPYVLLVWTRKAEMVPSRRLLVPIAAYMIVYVYCQSQAMALNGLGRVRGQMFYGIAAAILNVALSISLGLGIGIAGVAWATDIASLIPAVCASIELGRALREREAPGSAGGGSPAAAA